MEPEIRELIEESIRARVGSGSTGAAVESSVLQELGDPERLAAAYADRSLTLIGPRYYLDWLRLLKTITFTVVPIGVVAVFVAQLLVTGTIGAAIGSAVSTGIQVTVHVGFWTTLLFVIIDRSSTTYPGCDWSPEHLPDVPDEARQNRLAELVASLVFLAFFGATILWQQLASVMRDEGGSPIPVLDPALWSFWIPWFLGLIIVEACFAVWLYRQGWTSAAAIVNLLLALAFVIPVVTLWSQERILNPGLVEAAQWDLDLSTGGGWTVSAIVITSLVIIATWDIADGFLKARRAQRP